VLFSEIVGEGQKNQGLEWREEKTESMEGGNKSFPPFMTIPLPSLGTQELQGKRKSSWRG